MSVTLALKYEGGDFQPSARTIDSSSAWGNVKSWGHVEINGNPKQPAPE
jgi:hypothetical protein